MRRTKSRQREIEHLEKLYLTKQRRGSIPPCYRPQTSAIDLGAVHNCVLKSFPENPTTRFCPGCVKYCRNAATVRCNRARKAQLLLVAEFQDAAVDNLAQEKEVILAASATRAQELVEVKASIQAFVQEKAAIQHALKLAQTALHHQQCCNATMLEQFRATRSQLSSMTFYLGKEVSEHRQTKQQLAVAYHRPA